MNLFGKQYEEMNGEELDAAHNVLEIIQDKEKGNILSRILEQDVRKVVELRHKIKEIEDEFIFAIERFADLKIRAHVAAASEILDLEDEVMRIVYTMRNRMYEMNKKRVGGKRITD
jgi:hypothetical protein